MRSHDDWMPPRTSSRRRRDATQGRDTHSTKDCAKCTLWAERVQCVCTLDTIEKEWSTRSGWRLTRAGHRSPVSRCTLSWTIDYCSFTAARWLLHPSNSWQPALSIGKCKWQVVTLKKIDFATLAESRMRQQKVCAFCKVRCQVLSMHLFITNGSLTHSVTYSLSHSLSLFYSVLYFFLPWLFLVYRKVKYSLLLNQLEPSLRVPAN